MAASLSAAALLGVLLATAHTHALPPQGRSIAAMRRPALAARTRTSPPFMKPNSPAALRGGSAAEGAPASDDTAQPETSAGDTALTTLLLALWYASSIVNNQSSKVLVSLLGAEVLTLNQLLISAGCGTLVLRQSPLRFDSRPHLILTATLAASFLAGCYTLNSCLASMHVSLAMVLRSAEPLTTLALGAMLLPAKEQPPLRKALALLPVVLGCGLSAVGPHGPTATSLVLVAISNICFSLRAILGRRLKAAHGTGPVRLFSQMSLIAAGLQALVLGGRALFSPVAARAELTGAATVLACCTTACSSRSPTLPFPSVSKYARMPRSSSSVQPALTSSSANTV